MQKEINETWRCRWSPTLGDLESTAEEVWGTIPANNLLLVLGQEIAPVVFFGLYGLPDFYHLWRHKGRKCILWAGTDIIHFKNGYWLEDGGSIKISPKPLATWINKHCESYVENEVEAKELRNLGIESKIVPSFLGNVNDFPLSYKTDKKVRLYTSVSGDNFEQYGWDKIPKLARDNPDVEFHLYGNNARTPWCIPINIDNIFIHGRVPKEQMNEEVKEMTGALRLTEFDGFSEIIAKSLLWGQWPVSIIPYPHTVSLDGFGPGIRLNEPNIKGREWLLSVVNKYPWNKNI